MKIILLITYCMVILYIVCESAASFYWSKKEIKKLNKKE
tara:strand:- start:417 stop:533 length:117 start_codon:yes stop_codon:yes gene_type:complete